MAQHGTYYDPNIGLVLQNYLENKPKYFGIGNYNEEGFAFMEKGVAIVRDTFKKSLTHKNLKIIYGTDQPPAHMARTIANSLCAFAMAVRIRWRHSSLRRRSRPNR